MKLGVFGGTFDPPHIAHLVTAEVAYRQAKLDSVSFIPAGDPWQKRESSVSPAAQRMSMVAAAIESIEYFELDAREVERDGPSYTIETVEELAAEGHDPVLIVGADSALNLPTWSRWETLLAQCRLAVVPRSGIDPSDLNPTVRQAAIWLDMPQLHLSSSDIRSRVQSTKPYRFMVSEAVRKIIKDSQLYV